MVESGRIVVGEPVTLELGFAPSPRLSRRTVTPCCASMRLLGRSWRRRLPASCRRARPTARSCSALVTASWDAFAGELGLTGVRLLAREPVPYVDLLGLDEERQPRRRDPRDRRHRRVAARPRARRRRRRRLLGPRPAAERAHRARRRRRQESPALVLVAGGYDPRALATIDWLASRHEVPVSAYSVAMVRFGAERLLSVRREPSDEADARPARSTGCSRAAPRPEPAQGGRTPRLDAAAASLAEEQAEDAPELLGAPRRRRRRGASAGRARPRSQPCASSASTAARVALGHGERGCPGRAPRSAAPRPRSGSRARIGSAGHGGRSATADEVERGHAADERRRRRASARSSPVTRASSAATASRSAARQRPDVARHRDGVLAASRTCGSAARARTRAGRRSGARALTPAAGASRAGRARRSPPRSARARGRARAPRARRRCRRSSRSAPKPTDAPVPTIRPSSLGHQQLPVRRVGDDGVDGRGDRGHARTRRR